MINKNKKKKKGFTLVELIAVIAILAILGAILVPKISGYSAKASSAKDLANAKIILSAFELYNADNEAATVPDTVKVTSDNNTAPVDATGTVGLLKYMPTMPKAPVAKSPAKNWTTMTIAEIRTYASSLED